MGSSRTGVASPLSTDWWDDSPSSPVFFLLTFLLFRTFVLVLLPDEEEGGKWGPLRSLPCGEYPRCKGDILSLSLSRSRLPLRCMGVCGSYSLQYLLYHSL